MKSEITIPCLHCLYLRDWTRFDAEIRTMIKEYESCLFISAKSRPCVYCKPKLKIPSEPWSGLKEYFEKRNL